MQQNFVTACDRYIENRIGHQLNDMQTKAALHTCGPELIIAGAGTGKTTVLVNRIVNLLKFGTSYQFKSYDESKFSDRQLEQLYRCEGNEELDELLANNAPNPWNILAITFTNKAAGELRNRIAKAVGEDLAKDITAQTFHSLCAKLLRIESKYTEYQSHFTIYDSDDSKRVMKDIIKDKYDPDGNGECDLDAQTALDYIQTFKDNMKSVDDVEEDIRNCVYDTLSIEYQYVQLYKPYQEFLKSADAMDFDDLIFNMVKLLEQNSEVLDKYQTKYKYILVDEYQDTSKAQSELVKLLAGGWFNVCVVGDEDQSIYSFRGAVVDNILKFPDIYPGTYVVTLEQNYRSTGNILKLANQVIKNNKNRTEKALWTKSNSGAYIEYKDADSDIDEQTWIADQIQDNKFKYSETVILYRMNQQSASIERVFINKKIPYRIVGGLKFFDRKEVKDILQYLQMLVNPKDTVRIKRIINVPARRIGNQTVEKVERIAKDNGITMIDVCRNPEKWSSIKRAGTSLRKFYDIYESLVDQLDKIPLQDLIQQIYDESEYENAILGSTNFDDRKMNIAQLESMADDFERNNPTKQAQDFLEEISLLSDVDSYDDKKDCVTLMTMHASKGLEFNNVFVIGWNDGIFPQNRVIQEADLDPDRLEEERRLAYVAITRARKRLFISRVDQMFLWGQFKTFQPSRFLMEFDTQVFKDELKQLNRYKNKKTDVNKKKSERLVNLPVAGDTVTDQAGNKFELVELGNLGKCHLAFIKNASGTIERVIWEYANLRIVD